MTNDNKEFFDQIKELVKAKDIKGAISLAETKYPEGIYFGMPSNDYFALPYFSRSASKEVLFDLEEAEYSLNNPVIPTAAMDLGTAIHSMFLEPKDFDAIYVKAPSPEDFSQRIILKTVDDFKEILKIFGKKLSGKKEEIIGRFKELVDEKFVDPEKYIVWDEMIEKFHADVAKDNKMILTNNDFEILAGLRESLLKRQDIPRIIQNGYAEVTIIWKDEITGIMCKCRLDYVRPEAMGDVKSFTVKHKDKSLFEYLFKLTTGSYYNYQYAIYDEALETIINKINAGKAKSYGKVDSEWMKEFLKNPTKQAFIVYARTAAPYQMKAIELERSNAVGGSKNEYYSVAQKNWRLALSKFSRAVETGVWREKEVAVLEDAYVSNVIYQESIY